MMTGTPRFDTLALGGLPRLDYGDMFFAAKPPGTSDDPREWAETIFSLDSIPGWVKAALGLRQLLAPLIGVARAPKDTFSITAVAGEEALISVDARHLDFRCAIGVDAVAGIVRIVTTVRLKGWRGRLYFAPVRLAHPAVVDAMLRRSLKVMRRRVAGQAPRTV